MVDPQWKTRIENKKALAELADIDCEHENTKMMKTSLRKFLYCLDCENFVEAVKPQPTLKQVQKMIANAAYGMATQVNAHYGAMLTNPKGVGLMNSLGGEDEHTEEE